ncbi:MAG: tRNA (adenosine(37)-N6)-dimethylallyltransferase MiaA [Dermabacter sp.]|nr:tRNA (adenosine(37)-N6)-dimethylallyltransferase MiaA [Dermabacter sp.]
MDGDPGQQERPGGVMPLVVIAGATATGKSDLALDLAERVGGEIINADALQLYRGMDIGTAKTPLHERRSIAHHLFDTHEVSEDASVQDYQVQARRAVADVRARGAVPIAVGGSGLYLRALTDRLEFPPSDARVRAEIEEWASSVGLAAAHARLAQSDPVAASSIGVGDMRRIVRALEVGRLTSRPFSAFMPTYTFEDPNVVYVAVRRERAELYERVQARVECMMQAGFLDEVRGLVQRGIERGLTARQAIGYAQLLAHLRGEVSLDDAIEQTIVGTRKLVRKQDTWFRRDPRFTWVQGADPSALSLIERDLDHASRATTQRGA